MENKINLRNINQTTDKTNAAQNFAAPEKKSLAGELSGATSKIGELKLQSGQQKAILLAQANQMNAASKIKYSVPVAEGRSEVSYDGMYIGANGRAYTSVTPLAQIPAVMPKQGATTKRIIYVNGITTPKSTHYQNMKDIANDTGAGVIGIHNSTNGTGWDLVQCAKDKADVGKNPAHDTLTQTIVSELNQGHSVHILAHSQGGLITARSLRWAETLLYKQEIAKRGSMINPLIKREAREEVQRLMGKIRVETFGAAAASYPDGPRYVHYVNDADKVPTQFGIGDSNSPVVKWVAGKDAVAKHFKADFPGKKLMDVIPNYTPTGKNLMDLNFAPHSIENCYMSYRLPFAQARKEGSGFMNSPVRPFRRSGYEIHEKQ